ncbi:MAG: DUF305 domain-containing protein, partial [bacterium]
RALALPAVALLAAGTLAACGSTTPMDTTAPSSTAPSSTPQSTAAGPPVMPSPADAMFAQMMIPHHEQAVVMSDYALANTSNPEVLALAEQIKAAQQPEIEQMTSWLEEWGVPVMSGMDAMGAHGGHGMSGMLTDEQLDELADASDAEFDALYLAYMIDHHEGAIDMAQGVVDSQDPRVAALAAAIIEAQRAEIVEMQRLLGE